MYHKKSYESVHSFDFCKNGREILDVVLYFGNDDDANDNKKTEEMSFNRAFLIVKKNVFDD